MTQTNTHVDLTKNASSTTFPSTYVSIARVQMQVPYYDIPLTDKKNDDNNHYENVIVLHLVSPESKHQSSTLSTFI